MAFHIKKSYFHVYFSHDTWLIKRNFSYTNCAGLVDHFELLTQNKCAYYITITVKAVNNYNGNLK